MFGLIRPRELEDLSGTMRVFRANQTAAFFSISRSSRSCRYSRRRRRNPSRSAMVRPSPRRPSSTSACCGQFRIVWAEHPNSRERAPQRFGPRGATQSSAAGTSAHTLDVFWSSLHLLDKVSGCPLKRVNSKSPVPLDHPRAGRIATGCTKLLQPVPKRASLSSNRATAPAHNLAQPGEKRAEYGSE